MAWPAGWCVTAGVQWLTIATNERVTSLRGQSAAAAAGVIRASATAECCPRPLQLIADVDSIASRYSGDWLPPATTTPPAVRVSHRLINQSLV